MYIDTHTHLSNNFGITPEKYIKNAIDLGVNYLIVSCPDRNSIIEGLDLIKKYNNIFLTIGFHPDEVENVNKDDINWIKSIILNNPKVVGIGEIGLDFHFDKDHKEEQKELFIKQLDLAKELDLPVVIHSRDAIQETYDILKNYNLIGDIHCFSGSVEMAKEFIKLGYYLGIGGVLTFSNSKLFEVVKSVGLNNLILETDSPYLSPFRGQVNESKNIPIIANKISDLLNINIEDVANITTKNAIMLFDLNIKL